MLDFDASMIPQADHMGNFVGLWLAYLRSDFMDWIITAVMDLVWVSYNSANRGFDRVVSVRKARAIFERSNANHVLGWDGFQSHRRFLGAPHLGSIPS